MSAPATNAFSPAPVMTTTRTASSAWSAVSVWRSSASVRKLSALRTFGRLIVTRATASSRSTRSVVNELGSGTLIEEPEPILKYTFEFEQEETEETETEGTETTEFDTKDRR